MDAEDGGRGFASRSGPGFFGNHEPRGDPIVLFRPEFYMMTKMGFILKDFMDGKFGIRDPFREWAQ
jgi:hypothetical protein